MRVVSIDRWGLYMRVVFMTGFAVVALHVHIIIINSRLIIKIYSNEL